MYWNYRVVRKDIEGGARFDIHAVYYDEETDAIDYWSVGPLSPSGETIDWLKQLHVLHK